MPGERRAASVDRYQGNVQAGVPLRRLAQSEVLRNDALEQTKRVDGRSSGQSLASSMCASQLRIPLIVSACSGEGEHRFAHRRSEATIAVS